MIPKLERSLLSLPFIAILASGAWAQDDGVASLPVFEGPFPETENIRFLSQIDPEDLGALPVPGVWAKGMMNDLWGWTSPNGEEYALATNSGGIAFVRVTDPKKSRVPRPDRKPTAVRLPEHLGRSGDIRERRVFRDRDRRIRDRDRGSFGA